MVVHFELGSLIPQRIGLGDLVAHGIVFVGGGVAPLVSRRCDPAGCIVGLGGGGAVWVGSLDKAIGSVVLVAGGVPLFVGFREEISHCIVGGNIGKEGKGEEQEGED